METQDIVERLRESATASHGYSIDRGSVDAGLAGILADEAAAEISRLRAEVERLREALREIAEHRPVYDYIGADETGKISLHAPGSPYDRGKRDEGAFLSARARKALGGGE